MAEQTGWLRPVYKREQYDQLRNKIQSVLDSFAGVDVCAFQFCPGPDAEFRPMATCVVCAAQMDLRAALAGKPLPSQKSVPARDTHTPEAGRG